MSTLDAKHDEAKEMPKQTVIDIEHSMGLDQQQQDTEPKQIDPFSGMQVSHKQISDRFIELLAMFDKYTKMIIEDNSYDVATTTLKRARSEQLYTSSHCDLTQASPSLCDIQDSDITLKRPLATCEVSIQTSKSLLPGKHKRLKPKAKSFDQFYLPQHIFVEKKALAEERTAVPAAASVQRLTWQQKLRQMLANVGQTLFSFVNMVGHNLTYILFVFVCCGCLYLVISNHSSFLQNNTKSLKQDLTHLRPR